MKNSNRNLRSASTCGKETWEMSQSHNSKDCERQKLVFVLIHATEILIKFYAEISDSFSFIFFWLCEVFVKLKTFLMSLARDAEKNVSHRQREKTLSTFQSCEKLHQTWFVAPLMFTHRYGIFTHWFPMDLRTLNVKPFIISRLLRITSFFADFTLLSFSESFLISLIDIFCWERSPGEKRNVWLILRLTTSFIGWRPLILFRMFLYWSREFFE